MKAYSLFIGIVSSAISGVISAVMGLIALFNGEIFGGLAAIFLVAPISFALMHTFSHVLEQHQPGGKEGDTYRTNEHDRGGEPVHPTADTAGTPWAKNPGATNDSF
jgi:hypothetical protein